MSNLQFKATVKNYSDADKFIGGNLAKKLAYETKLIRLTDGRIAMTYHGNIIVIFDGSDDTVSFTLSGWGTPTTRNRINKVLPIGYGVTQKNFKQFFSEPGKTERELDIYDVVTVTLRNKVDA